MPVNTSELMTVVCKLADQQNMKVTLHESLKGGCIAGSFAVAGGLVLGPSGLAFGGIIGSIAAAWMSQGKFKSVAHVIMYDMTPRQQEELATHVQNVIGDIRAEDAILLLAIISRNPLTTQAVLEATAGFIKRELNLSILN